MNLPEAKPVLVTLFMTIFFRFSNGQGLTLTEMLQQHGKHVNTIVEPVAQQTQIDPVYANYPYAASTDPRFNVQISNLLATNVLQMAHDVGETLLNSRSEKTEVFSPLSIYGALSLLLLGSNGNTYQELSKLMGLNKDQYLINNPWKIHEEFGILIDDITQNVRNEHHPRSVPNWKAYGNPQSEGPNVPNEQNNGDEYKIEVANGVFVQQGFSIRPDYRTAVLNVYKSNMQNLDFARDSVRATKYINDWVNEKTHGKIPEIVSFFQPETKVVLASALYFKASWEQTFIEGATGPKNFYPDGLGTTPITVQMMAHGGTFPFYNSVEYDCRILALPYRRNLSTMYIILPNNSSRYRLRQLQSYLTADKIDDMISKMEWKTAIILFPKMHITNEVDLKKTFEKMGLHSLFDERRSDLSLISNGYEVINGNNNQFQYAAQPAAAQPVAGQPLAAQPLAAKNNIPLSTGFPTANNVFVPQDTNNRFNVGGYAHLQDDSDDEPFLFSRHGEDDESENTTSTEPPNTPSPTTEETKSAKETDRKKRNVSYKAPSSSTNGESSLRFKDYILSKRIIKGSPVKKHIRQRRQIDPSLSLKDLDRLRTELSQGGGQNPGLFASEIIHKVDLTVNEKGTEGGAATITTLYRTGTDVIFRVDTPFLFIVRHDDTKLPLFYGTVVEPTF